MMFPKLESSIQNYVSSEKLIYSLHTHKKSYLEQQLGLQSLVLTSCFYKNIFFLNGKCPAPV